MTSHRRLRVVAAPPPAQPPAQDATSTARFTREVVTPPGPPWRQRQVAELEARLAAPISGDELAYRIYRSERWKLSHPARFAIVYTRGASGSGRVGSHGSVSATASVGLSALEDERTRIIVAIGICLISLMLFGFGGSSALDRRAKVDAELATLDSALLPMQHRAATIATLDRQANALDQMGGRDRSASRVVSDLDWLAAHRRPEALVANLHWLHGVSAIETTASGNPFIASDRRIQRASHPIRPGVWLWGVADPQGADR